MMVASAEVLYIWRILWIVGVLHQENRKLCGDVYAISGQPVNDPPSDELSNAGALDAISDGPSRTTRQPKWLLRAFNKPFNRTFNGSKRNANRNAKLFNTELKTALNEIRVNHSKWGAVSLACDASPHPLWTTLWSQKCGGGGWPLGSPDCPRSKIRKSTFLQIHYQTKTQLLESEALGTLGGSHEHA